MAQSPKTSQGGASLSSKRRPPSTKTVQSIRSQPPLSLTMEVEEITHALRWIASKVTVGLHMPSSSQIQWACYKKRNGKPRLECVNGRHTPAVTFGHAGVKGNERADRLTGKAAFTSGLLLGRSEVLRSLRLTLPTGIKTKDISPSVAPGGEMRGKLDGTETQGPQR